MSDCPLCSIPHREPLLYEDELIYITETKDQKGHELRVMVVLKEHKSDPTLREFTHSLSKLSRYMEENSPTCVYYLVFGTYASIPDHYHVIGCDDVLEEAEAAKLFSSDYVRCLITGGRK